MSPLCDWRSPARDMLGQWLQHLPLFLASAARLI